MSKFVPFSTRKRLPIYYKLFKTLEAQGVISVTSLDVANYINIDATTIRRDFSAIGKLGKKGQGYVVTAVLSIFEDEFELNVLEKAVIIGFGHLGQAVAAYFSSVENFIDISQIYDVSEDIIDTKFNDIIIRDYKSIKKTIDSDTSIAILTLPGKYAQKTLDKLVDLGIRGFVNFTGRKIFCENKDVIIYDIDIAQTMQSLVYDLRDNH